LHIKSGFYCKIAHDQYIHELIKRHPKVFFAPDLVNAILDQGSQELGSHSFGHFDCLDEFACVDGFSNDIDLFRIISSQFGIKAKSFVFPRNNISDLYICELEKNKFKCFRSNHSHFLYANGHDVKLGSFGRLLRFADSYFPISRKKNILINNAGFGINALPADLFLRPWSNLLSSCDILKVKRIKDKMTFNAKNGVDFHLWWHPHNFGINLEKNIFVLRHILQHYQGLEKQYGMCSISMGEIGVARP